jgi:hypothetical protein
MDEVPCWVWDKSGPKYLGSCPGADSQQEAVQTAE